MDFLEGLGKQLSEVSAYDIKSYYNQAKNIVMNYTPMEAKVREATNDDAWGASSTLMQEIAQGTHNFQLFNEIMPTIYKRFTEKEASEWRQIYKALQLLEYLVKHGSERVIDDARTHVSMVKILRNFHHIDEKGKDQGINVRNRAKELSELLSDSDKIRQERKKARVNKNKYGGISNEEVSFRTGSGSRYGGFGSDALGYTGNNDDDGRSASAASYRESSSRRTDPDVEEYDAGEWEERPAASGSRTSAASRSAKSSAGPTPPPKKPVKEMNLFDFDDDEPAAASAPTVAAPTPKSAAPIPSLDDDFDDFVAAPTSNPAQTMPALSSLSISSAQPSQAPVASKPNFFDIMNSAPSSARPPSAPAPTSMFGMGSPSLAPAPQSARPSSGGSFAPMAPASNATKKSSDAFGDLWSASTPASSTASTVGGKSMADLAKQKAESNLFSAPQGGATGSSSKFDDFLL